MASIRWRRESIKAGLQADGSTRCGDSMQYFTPPAPRATPCWGPLHSGHVAEDEKEEGSITARYSRSLYPVRLYSHKYFGGEQTETRYVARARAYNGSIRRRCGACTAELYGCVTRLIPAVRFLTGLLGPYPLHEAAGWAGCHAM